MELETYTRVIDTVRPVEGKNYPVVEAEYVQMPDGKRLSESTIVDGNYAPKLLEGVAEILPDNYYVFGEVDELSVTLIDVDDGRVHEYCFEFKPTEDFTNLAITPTPVWAYEPVIRSGMTSQVSVLRGIAVMLSA